MKIALATIFYNNAKELERLVNSIPDKTLGYFIGVDGIFRYIKEQHPDLSNLSVDGSREILLDQHHKKFATCLFILDNSTEFDKRNTYLRVAEALEIDCIIIVDTDEMFYYEPGYTPEDSWNRFRKNLEFEMRRYPGHNVFGIRYLDEAGTDTYKPRVWVNPSKMRYVYGSHYNYANIETEAKDIEYFKSQNLNSF